MLCDGEDEWRTGMCDIWSLPRYAYTAAFPCFVSRNIMRKVLDTPGAHESSWLGSIASCIGCGICSVGLADIASQADNEVITDACVIYTGVWCCTIPLAYLLRTTVVERLNKAESCVSSLLLSVCWWPCMLTQTEREEWTVDYDYDYT